MTDVPMPVSALEAGAQVLADINGWRDEQGLIACMPVARLCFLAILEAWPGMAHYRGGWEPVIHNNRKPHLILPLPTEASHE